MPILIKGKTFTTGEQLTATKLNDLVDLATFASGAVASGGGLSVTSGGTSLFVTDLGIIESKLATNSVSTTKIVDAAVTPAKLSSYAPSWTSTTTSISNSLDFAPISSSTTGTYTRTGYIITVSMTAHGMIDGTIVTLDFTSGAGSDGSYIISGVGANQFTVTDTVTGTTSGNCTRTSYYGNSRVRGSQTIDGNLSVAGSASITGSLNLSGSAVNLLTRGTVQNATSGTSIDFTSIPSWAKRITVLLNGISLSGTSQVLIQLGAGSILTTGYASTSIRVNNTTSSSGGSSTSGFIVSCSSSAEVTSGSMQIALISSNSWVSSHSGKCSTTICVFGGGNVSLSGALDRIRITSVNGTDTIDAGSINIMYE
jgi:hypothetical protein